MRQIVVALRWGADPIATESVALIAEGVRAAMERASIGGAHLVGAVSDGATFGFDEDALDEAIDLAIALVRDGRWKCGVAVGELEAVREEGSFLRLSVGAGMARAAALSRAARGGEVLVDRALPQASGGALLSIGRRVASAASKTRIRGLVLDVKEPWRRDGGEAVERLREPRVVGREAALEAIKSVEPGGLGVVRAAAGHGGTRFLDELVIRTARALLVAPVGCSVEPLGALRVAVIRGLERRRRVAAAGHSLPPLSSRAADGTQRLREGQGVDVDGASEVATEWLTPEPEESETPLLLIDDAMTVDRATLEAIGLAAAAPGAPFAVVARLDVGEPIPAALASLVVEADVTLKPLTPHESIEVLDDACGGAKNVHPDVRKRWTRRGGGVPLGIVEALRHGLAVGELAVRDGVISPRGKSAGRGRMLSPHGWATRRLAALSHDRPNDATLATIVAISGGGLPLGRLDEIASDSGLPTGEALDVAVARLAREGVVSLSGDRVSPASRTLREAAIDRADEATRRRLHAAVAAAIARTAKGLDLAEGSHHAALAGDHLAAAALAMRASDRARSVGLDEWADALASFARAEGSDLAPNATTPSPPPRPSVASRKPPTSAPAPPPAAPKPPKVRDPDKTEEDVEPIDLDSIAPGLGSSAPDPIPLPREPTPLPRALPKPATAPPIAKALTPFPKPPSGPPPVVVAPKPAPPRPAPPDAPSLASKPALQHPVTGAQKIASPRIAVAAETSASGPPSIALGTLKTGEIAALPPPSAANIPVAAPRKPPGPPPRPSGMTGLMPAVHATEEVAPIEISMREVEPVSEPPPESKASPASAPKSNRPAHDLLHDATRALLARDLDEVDRLLRELDTLGSKSAALTRMRGLSALARGDLGLGMQLLRRARTDAKDDRDMARATLAYAIALGAAGRRQDAIVEALEALAVEKRIDDQGNGPDACRRLIERLLQ